MTQVTQYMTALATMALLAGGCAHGSSSREGAADNRTMIRVTNNNWSDMTIYLVHSGSQRRLGTVTSHSTHSFIVAAHQVESGRVHLMADPIGSSRVYISAPIMIHRGQTAEWQLENSLSLSSIWIR